MGDQSTTQQMSIRLPRRMFEKIKRAAREERRSMNAQIIKILEDVVRESSAQGSRCPDNADA